MSRLVLTASGGPFLRRPLDTFASITPAEALAHPTWNMGPKVTINSATMMNKGLEVIEAHFLFDTPYASIDVAIHPTSIVHSWVEFRDGAVVAQMGVPDMRVPIALALADGERLPGVGPAPRPSRRVAARVPPVDGARFPAVALARAAGERGGLAPCVFNAANEEAVTAFMAGRCRFDEIVPLVGDALAAFDDGDASDARRRARRRRVGARLRPREHGCGGRGAMTQFLIYAGAFILVLVSVITVHEFGHFAVGKLSGIKVEEFAIGFGPKIYSRRIGETLYAIRADPRRRVRAHGRHARSHRRK